MDSLLNSLQDFTRNVRFVDFLDMALISFFLYLLINWFRKSSSSRAVFSMFILFCLYLLARITEMYLTELLIEGLFIVILIGMVVVFQSDIRRLIDRIASLGLYRHGRSATASDNPAIEIISEAAGYMADKHIGGLIAVKGREDWERHIHGGVELKGDVSIPLLHSIFNPASAGHDGAVLMENNEITKFSVHLPLSTRLDEIGRGGTRHAAGLGLSEVCDALVIIISEERGVISVARNGRLEELESAGKLKGRLLSFWEEYYQSSTTGWTNHWQRIHIRTAFASAVLALLFWFSFAYDAETVYRTFAVPIEYRNLNTSNVALEDSLPIEARVTLSGPEQAFRLLEPSQLAISFDLDSANIDTEQLQITENNIDLPSDLNLYEVSPRFLTIEIYDFTRGDFPVKIPTEGELPSGFTLESITADPDTVTLLVPEGEQPDSISVDTVDLSNINGSAEIQKNLTVPAPLKLPQNESGEITVRIEVGKNEE